MRHAKSCSNLVRDHDLETSQTIRDPGLSLLGVQQATTLAPILKIKLKSMGIDTTNALIGSSGLKRASETARLIFGKEPVTFANFREMGAIPENTPSNDNYVQPEWTAFLRDLFQQLQHHNCQTAVVVGHGSFISKHVLQRNSTPFSNLDGVLITGELVQTGELIPFDIQKVKAPIDTTSTSDSCFLEDKNKIRRINRRMTKSTKTKRGGGYTTPLSYFMPNAQFSGTTSYPTGMVSNAPGMIRAPLNQTAGRRTRRRQQGGWTPSVMGSFVSNGARMLPWSAAYLGYKNSKSTHKRTRKSTRKSKSTRKEHS